MCIRLRSHWGRLKNEEIKGRAINLFTYLFEHQFIHPFRELSNGYSMSVTVVDPGENRKHEIQVLILTEPPFQLMERRVHKISEDRQMGMRSHLLESQSHGENLVLKPISSF